MTMTVVTIIIVWEICAMTIGSRMHMLAVKMSKNLLVKPSKRESVSTRS